MTETFPIDVNYNDFLIWLSERYLIPKDWPKRLEAIKLKKSELLEQISLKEEKDYLKIKDSFTKEMELNYEQCKRLQSMLMKTEDAKQKTLFGGYSAPIIKNINLIISVYETNNVFLCEYAKLISQYVNYDIEAAEKNIQLHDKTIGDFSSRISDKNDTMKKLKSQVSEICTTYCLEKSITKEVQNLIEEITSQSELDVAKKTKFNERINSIYKSISLNLTNRLDDLEKKLKKIEENIKSKEILNCMEFYSEFFKLTNEDNDDERADKKNKQKNKKKIEVLEDLHPNILNELKTVNLNGDCKYNLTTKEIITSKSSENIYSIITEKKKDYIKLFETFDNFKGLFLQVGSLKNLISDETKKETEIFSTMLIDFDLRMKIVNNLTELKYFLMQRQLDGKTQTEISFLLYSDKLRALLNKYSYEQIESYLKQINSCINLLEEDADFKFLLRLMESEREISKIIGKLDFSYELLVKSKDDLITFYTRQEESKLNIKLNEKTKEEIKKELKSMKKLIDKTLTTLLKRKISIMGSKHLF